jgi:ribonuclease D
VAAARLARCREVVTGTAAEHKLPPENLITPDTIRRLAWTPPEEITPETVAATLRGYGARAWQVGLIADDLAVALEAPAKPDPPTA